MKSKQERYWVVIPAAGVGKRMGANRPKQYLDLNGQTVLENTLDLFIEIPRVAGITIAIGAEDLFWTMTKYASHPKVHSIEGGRERAHSVLNALESLQDTLMPNDWVIVHDAARPCLRGGDLKSMMDAVAQEETGSILAVPVKDTIKYVDCYPDILETVDRNKIWLAQTPQIFRYSYLSTALSDGLSRGLNITDEASAMEMAGYKVKVFEGHSDNIKITTPEDLQLASWILEQHRHSN